MLYLIRSNIQQILWYISIVNFSGSLSHDFYYFLPDFITIHYDSACEDSTIGVFFVDGFDMEKIATTPFNPIKNQVLHVHHLGAGVEESVPGQSIERHKELDDKKSKRTRLVGLTGDAACQQIVQLHITIITIQVTCLRR